MSKERVIRLSEHSNHVLKDLKQQKERKVLCDVVIAVKGRLIPAHRNVLAACSDYFKNMFTTEMKEKYEETIELRGVSPGAVEEIINFCYRGEITLNANNVSDVLHAASLMQIQSLLDTINDFLTESISPPNCLNLLETGRAYSLKKLEEKSHECLMVNFEKVSQQSEFFATSVTDLENILKSNNLSVASESIVYQALIKWVKHSSNERRDIFPRLFKLIRLNLLQAEFLSDVVSKEPLVREFFSCRDLVDEAFRFHLKPNKENLARRKNIEQDDTNSIALFSDSPIVHIFNLDSKQWSYIAAENNNTPRYSTVTMRDEEVFICTSSNYKQTRRYQNGVWTQETNLPTQRSGAGSAFVNGDLYLVGGGYPNTNLDSVLTYNLGKKTWTEHCKMKTQRNQIAVVATNDYIYVLGGFTAFNNVNSACCTVERLDVKTKTWVQLANMNTERADLGAVYYNSRIYVFGGLSNNNAQLSSVEFLDFDNGVWTTIATNVPVELGSTSVCKVAGRIAVLGSTSTLISFDPCTTTWRTESKVLPTIKGALLVALKTTDEER